jgi:hypothetical protein
MLLELLLTYGWAIMALIFAITVIIPIILGLISLYSLIILNQLPNLLILWILFILELVILTVSIIIVLFNRKKVILLQIKPGLNQKNKIYNLLEYLKLLITIVFLWYLIFVKPIQFSYRNIGLLYLIIYVIIAITTYFLKPKDKKVEAKPEKLTIKKNNNNPEKKTKKKSSY